MPGRGQGRPRPAPQSSARRSRLSEASRDLGPAPRAFARSRESRALSLSRARRQDGGSSVRTGRGWDGIGTPRPPPLAPAVGREVAEGGGEARLRVCGGRERCREAGPPWRPAARAPGRERGSRGSRCSSRSRLLSPFPAAFQAKEDPEAERTRQPRPRPRG